MMREIDGRVYDTDAAEEVARERLEADGEE